MKHNYRRKQKADENLRDVFDASETYVGYGSNGYPRKRGKHLDKSMHGWGTLDTFSDKHIGASIGNDFSNGKRGMAKAVRGAKKYVRTRTRFHSKMMTQKLIRDGIE